MEATATLEIAAGKFLPPATYEQEKTSKVRDQIKAKTFTWKKAGQIFNTCKKYFWIQVLSSTDQTLLYIICVHFLYI